MARYAFTLPWPPSLNRIWRNGGGITYKTREAKDYGWHVAAALNLSDVPLLTGDVTVSLTLYRPAKRGDVDNYSKVILDCLQGRAYQNDNQIVELHIVRRDDRKYPRVEVEIQEIA